MFNEFKKYNFLNLKLIKSLKKNFFLKWNYLIFLA